MNVKMYLTGSDELRRAIKLADPAARERTKAAIRQGTKQVVAGAIARAPKLTGEMASTIRDEYSKDEMIGYAKVGFGKLPRRLKGLESSRLSSRKRAANIKKRGRRLGKGAFAPVIEHGDPRRNRTANPFMVPALDQARPSIISDITQALRTTTAEIAR